MAKTNELRARGGLRLHPGTKEIVERALADGTFVPGSWDEEVGNRPCPMAPRARVAWRTTMTWLVANPDAGERDWVAWSYRIPISLWVRFPIRDASEFDAVYATGWIDDYELDDESDRLAGRLGTYWADA